MLYLTTAFDDVKAVQGGLLLLKAVAHGIWQIAPRIAGAIAIVSSVMLATASGSVQRALPVGLAGKDAWMLLMAVKAQLVIHAVEYRFARETTSIGKAVWSLSSAAPGTLLLAETMNGVTEAALTAICAVDLSLIHLHVRPVGLDGLIAMIQPPAAVMPSVLLIKPDGHTVIFQQYLPL